MKRELIFNVIYFDTIKGSHNMITTFFNESDIDDNDESVTLMTESQAIKWLLQIDHFRHLFFTSFFNDILNVKDFYGLKEPFTQRNKKPGDIDLLLVNTY